MLIHGLNTVKTIILLAGYKTVKLACYKNYAHYTAPGVNFTVSIWGDLILLIASTWYQS